jgi:hypothetical protein
MTHSHVVGLDWFVTLVERQQEHNRLALPFDVYLYG